ncbi:hypothetical protein [Bacillus sp. CDB3]|uniref:hypothetical protein n=1 Tax=Bacillus sp. CDB3 TaxID=360310 RepID=UPI0009D7C7F0|nr:hypothetical protein [Bacillus sp. CDB3]OQR53492.1 hypothetical protein CDB3_29485 [Bacillus sp. CDB3]
MNQEKGRVYSPTNVQELLKIDSSTLRKYAILLLKNDYTFFKTAYKYSIIIKRTSSSRLLVPFIYQIIL